MSKFVIMSVAAGLMATLAMTASDADAKGKYKYKHVPKSHKHHVHKWHKWHVMPYRYASLGKCEYYFWKWQSGGGSYWKNKYRFCAGIY